MIVFGRGAEAEVAGKGRGDGISVYESCSMVPPQGRTWYHRASFPTDTVIARSFCVYVEHRWHRRSSVRMFTCL